MQGRRIYTRLSEYLSFSSFSKEEYPKGEVVAIHAVEQSLMFKALCSLPPRPLGTPPPRRRGVEILRQIIYPNYPRYLSGERGVSAYVNGMKYVMRNAGMVANSVKVKNASYPSQSLTKPLIVPGNITPRFMIPEAKA